MTKTYRTPRHITTLVLVSRGVLLSLQGGNEATISLPDPLRVEDLRPGDILTTTSDFQGDRPAACTILRLGVGADGVGGYARIKATPGMYSPEANPDIAITWQDDRPVRTDRDKAEERDNGYVQNLLKNICDQSRTITSQGVSISRLKQLLEESESNYAIAQKEGQRALQAEAELTKKLADRESLISRLKTEVGFSANKLDDYNKKIKVLSDFKTWVHKKFDSLGVPADPLPEGNAKHGCRISGRFVWMEKNLFRIGGGLVAHSDGTWSVSKRGQTTQALMEPERNASPLRGRDPVIHALRSEAEYFDAVQRGDKTFEIRKNDRCFQVGDYLVLVRVPRGFTNQCVRITYITEFKQQPGYVVLGITPAQLPPDALWCHPPGLINNQVPQIARG